jgi:hypothetical protein
MPPEQPDLFDAPPVTSPSVPYVRHSATSKAAAESMEGKAGSLRSAVLSYLRAEGFAGATDPEIYARLGVGTETKEGTLRARRVELVSAGLVEDSGGRRNSGTGRQCVVWVSVTKK